MRYKLRTLLIVAGLGPPLLAGCLWAIYTAYNEMRLMRTADHDLSHYGGGATAVEHPSPELIEELQIYVDEATSVTASSRDPAAPSQ